MTNPPDSVKGKKISAAAKRALKEAAARKDAQKSKSLPKETGGPKGVEPTRHGEWERGGITYDF